MSQKLPHFVNATGKPIKTVFILTQNIQPGEFISHLDIKMNNFIQTPHGEVVFAYDASKNLMYVISTVVGRIQNFKQKIFTNHIDKILLIDINQEQLESEFKVFYDTIKESGISYNIVRLVRLGDVLDTLATDEHLKIDNTNREDSLKLSLRFADATGKPIQNVFIFAPFADKPYEFTRRHLRIKMDHCIDTAGPVFAFDESRNLMYIISDCFPEDFERKIFINHIDKILVIDIEQEHLESRPEMFYDIIKDTGISYKLVQLIRLGDVLDILAA